MKSDSGSFFPGWQFFPAIIIWHPDFGTEEPWRPCLKNSISWRKGTSAMSSDNHGHNEVMKWTALLATRCRDQNSENQVQLQKVLVWRSHPERGIRDGQGSKSLNWFNSLHVQLLHSDSSGFLFPACKANNWRNIHSRTVKVVHFWMNSGDGLCGPSAEYYCFSTPRCWYLQESSEATSNNCKLTG
jgi:hypothetical protein